MSYKNQITDQEGFRQSEKYLSDSIRNRFRDRHKDPKTILLRNLDRTAQRLCTVTDIGQSHTTGNIFGLIAV